MKSADIPFPHPRIRKNKMSDVVLLDKTRKLSRLLHDNRESKVVFNDICDVLSDVLEAEVFVVSKKGKILGLSVQENGTYMKEFSDVNVGIFLPDEINERFIEVLSTRENINPATLGLHQSGKDRVWAELSPIVIAGERFGTLFLCKKDGFEIDDIILTEYGASIVGLEMLRSEHEEHAAKKRHRRYVKSAFQSLSRSEKDAVIYVINELDDKKEGRINLSRLSEKVGITRSVIVNALRKLESADVIITKSAGVKGTYIKVLNDSLYEEMSAE